MKIYISIVLFCFLFVSCYKETAIPIQIDFSLEFVNNNKSAPAEIKVTNNTEGAEVYEWTFEGAEPSTSTKRNPDIVSYNSTGEYTITLVASNKDGVIANKKEKIKIYDNINIDFKAEIINNQANYPPVEVQISNQTKGVGLSYKWTFEGGSPSIYEGETPPVVIFSKPGNHKVTLTVYNGIKEEAQSKTITVSEDIISNFSWDVSLFDDDYQAPVTLFLKNTSTNATAYTWTLQSGSPSLSSEKEPTVIYKTPGTYKIKLKADNGSSSKVYEQTLNIYKNTNLRVFKDIKLGINISHTNNIIGAYFSTTTHKSYTASEINSANGKDIDIIFFGLDPSFKYNRFISPNLALEYGFPLINDAAHTIFVNSQEICNCGLNFTSDDFDKIVDDTLLKSLNITETVGGLQQFGNTVPRVVLFKTRNGKKGAIKIKKMVSEKNSSYILCDIKVQKDA